MTESTSSLHVCHNNGLSSNHFLKFRLTGFQLSECDYTHTCTITGTGACTCMIFVNRSRPIDEYGPNV